MEITLPSGLKVDLFVPNYGQEIHATSIGLEKGIEEFTYAKLAVVAPGLSREEIMALSRKDGRFLMSAVKRIWDER